MFTEKTLGENDEHGVDIKVRPMEVLEV